MIASGGFSTKKRRGVCYAIHPVAVAWDRDRQQRRIALAGRVKVHGDIWRARSQAGESLLVGDRAVVVGCREPEFVVRRERPS